MTLRLEGRSVSGDHFRAAIGRVNISRRPATLFRSAISESVAWTGGERLQTPADSGGYWKDGLRVG
jgi:hypothetical protein